MSADGDAFEGKAEAAVPSQADAIVTHLGHFGLATGCVTLIINRETRQAADDGSFKRGKIRCCTD